jgi:hypothetical protein
MQSNTKGNKLTQYSCSIIHMYGVYCTILPKFSPLPLPSDPYSETTAIKDQLRAELSVVFLEKFRCNYIHFFSTMELEVIFPCHI